MKRIICILIAAQMLLLAACGSGDESGKETTVGNIGGETTPSYTATSEQDRIDELGEHNFGGKKFTILDANDHPDWHVNIHGCLLYTSVLIRKALRYSVKVLPK